MYSNILELDCDNVIVGAGMSGLIASMRLRGKTIVVSSGLGATAISSGIISPGSDTDPVAEEWFLSLMNGTACRYLRGRCITDMFTSREGLVQEVMAYEGMPLFVALNGFPRSIGRQTVNVRFMEGRSWQEMAKLLETDDGALDELINSISGITADCIVLPPILGIDSMPAIREKVQDAIGAMVYEYATAPSVHGLRLISSLKGLAGQLKNVQILDPVRIDRISGSYITGYMGTKAKRGISINANNLIITTGGLLTGFRMDGDRIYEPLTGTTMSRDIMADFNDTFLSDHPVMFKGIGIRLPAPSGLKNVLAAGAIACGFGLYGALVTGYHAGDYL